MGIVIRLANQGTSTRQIAKAANISLEDICTILRRYTGGKDTAAANTGSYLSINAHAFELFKDNKDLVDFAITLNMKADEVLDLPSDYLHLLNMIN